jgi:hypothetical protein
MGMHTAETLVAEPSSIEVLTALNSRKGNKSSGIDQVLTKLIQTRGETLHSEIHENINCMAA